jgi:aryl-alcohol dehydrogenase-like predicted oxidoreductase
MGGHRLQNFPKNLELVESLTRIATSKGCTPGQLTLAWLMAQGDDIIPIPGETCECLSAEGNLHVLTIAYSRNHEDQIPRRKLGCPSSVPVG